jgi:uncharacterized protein YcbX
MDISEFGLKSGARTTVDGVLPTSMHISDAGPVINGWHDRLGVLGAVTDLRGRVARFVSQRGWASDAAKTKYPGDSDLTLVQSDIVAPGQLETSVPGYGQFVANVARANGTPDGELWDVGIHSGIYRAADLGVLAGEMFSTFLSEKNPGRPWRDIRLFVAPQNRARRRIRKVYQLPNASHEVNGADGAAILAVNDATLRWMQEEFGFSDVYISMLRARANLVLRGLPPLAEDYISALTVNGRRLENTGPSTRCVETGVDPATGERDDNRFLTILGRAARTGWSRTSHDRGAFFGFNLQPERAGGALTPVSVGDQVGIEWTDESNILKVKPNS